MGHPQIAVATKEAELILRSSDRLRMSPVARTRLTLEAQDAGGGKFSGLLGRIGRARLNRDKKALIACMEGVVRRSNAERAP